MNIQVNISANIFKEKNSRGVFGLQITEINAVRSSFSSTYHFPVTSVLSSLQIVTKEVQNCGLFGKVFSGLYNLEYLYLYVEICALVKY